MLKKIITAALIMVCCSAANSQALVKFELSVSTDSASFISLTEKKVWNKSSAAAHKEQLHLAVIPTSDAFGQRLEWYNLSGKDNRTPAGLNGNNTGIAAISFDREQFDKCHTAADLKRMTGHITKNSFTHFAGIGQNGNISQHCFITELENGKRGLIYVTEINAGAIKAIFKTQ